MSSVYEELDVPTVVNGMGTKTRLSGTLMRPEAADAMRDAARSFARISDLQARASELISGVTGAESGYVTNGAASGLTLAAAACIAAEDYGRMARLPDTDGMADEIVMARTHRNGYDHALRLAGATIVDIGTNDYHLGSGSVNVEPWEIADAISDETAAVAYMAKPYTQPDLETVVEIAHAHEVPVIVDAAAELPPTRNLERFVSTGADAVVFSGGKAIRGPQSSGILAGREDLVQSAALQHLDMHAAEEVRVSAEGIFDVDRHSGVPRQGLGRPMKVGKEELVGLLRALELFVEEDDDAVLQEWHDRATLIAEALRDVPAFDVELANANKTDVVTAVSVTVDEQRLGMSTVELVRGLREENPRVYVGGDDVKYGEFGVNPMCLSDDEAEYVVDRILAAID